MPEGSPKSIVTVFLFFKLKFFSEIRKIYKESNEKNFIGKTKIEQNSLSLEKKNSNGEVLRRCDSYNFFEQAIFFQFLKSPRKMIFCMT